MKNYFVLLFLLMLISSGCSYFKPAGLTEFDFNKDKETENSNFNNMHKMFMELDSSETEDYYFVVIGDSRNMVRSDDLSGFNFVAKQIIYAKDNDGYIYDKIKFIMHMGDIVYDGVAKYQWDNIKKAFSNKDYYENNYPYIKLLARQKPVFPVLGNHEIMKFKFKPETKYKNLASVNKGLQNFNDFFNWEEFMADSNILYSIPSELPIDTFTKLCNKIGANESDVMNKHYVLLEDNLYHLKIYQDFIEELKNTKPQIAIIGNYLDENKKLEVISDLYPIYNKLDYNVLPAISSDNMICYAFEIQDQIYFIMDSMSRGWHYNTFTQLKEGLFPKKQDQHDLNLFSKSDLNGQYEFYKALKEYADKHEKIIVPFMHHSAINSVNDIDGSGIQYNLKLMLGVDYDDKIKNSTEFYKSISDNTFFDELLFPDVQGEEFNYFTSCVHYYQGIEFNTYNNDILQNKINWYITGGGGGELETSHDDNVMYKTVDLLNRRLLDTYSVRNNEGDRTLVNPAIEVEKSEVEYSYNYLLVHVENGVISEVIPKFIETEKVKLKKPLIKLSATLSNPVYYEPISVGQLIFVSPWSWGLEKIAVGLSPFTWDPSFGVGYLNYDYNNKEKSEMASIEVGSPLRFKARFSNSREFIFNFFDFTMFNGGSTKARTLISAGMEGPLLYNFFYDAKEPWPSIYKRINFAYNYYFYDVDPDVEIDFAKDIKMSWIVKFSLF
jgi:hypothetical protein